MIGTMENAQLAGTFENYSTDIDNTCGCTCCQEDRAANGDPCLIPDGWSFIGDGCSRNAFLGPDGVVYKVLNRDGDGNYDSESSTCGHYNYDRANVQEFTNYIAYNAKLPATIRMAECYLWSREVLAMEYVQGRSPNYSEFAKEKEFVRKVSHNSIIDMHGGNCVVVGETPYVKGVLVLFDFAW